MFLLILSLVLHHATSTSLPRLVATWTPLDVARWMNVTVGYPEYTPTLLAHGVDGPTVLASSGDVVAAALGARHPLHAAKISAHVALLQGRCVCPTQPSDGLWGALRESPWSVWVVGGSLFFTPRVGMAAAFATDPLVWEVLVMGYTGVSETVVTLVMGIAWVAMPRLYLLLVTLPYLFTTWVVPCYMVGLGLGVAVEAAMLARWVDIVKDPKRAGWTAVKALGMDMFAESLTLFTAAPIVLAVTYYITPLVVQHIVIWGVAILSVAGGLRVILEAWEAAKKS